MSVSFVRSFVCSLVRDVNAAARSMHAHTLARGHLRFSTLRISAEIREPSHVAVINMTYATASLAQWQLMSNTVWSLDLVI